MSQQFPDQLKEYKKKNNIKTPELKSNKNAQKKESYSHDEIRELMGEYRPTYKRGRGGAIRQK